jgi:hypothetical protein
MIDVDDFEGNEEVKSLSVRRIIISTKLEDLGSAPHFIESNCYHQLKLSLHQLSINAVH